MQWWHVLGVLAGVVVGFFLTAALAIVWAVAMIGYCMSTGLSAHDAALQFNAAHIASSVPCLLATLGMGAFALLVGGLFAGWVAGSGQVMTGLATGIVSTVLSIPFMSMYTYPMWYNVAAVLVTILPAAMGGYLARVFANVRRVPHPAATQPHESNEPA